ncbi:HAD hydrolase-like protein [uncultured Tateyamaria sp.]|uniref:HAD-IIA family hydrolase n=1 Tax=uncultured Tateyamaria sp. TaxID=455651 RepID=UPI002620D972|nr:HAD hydrolase-like protein [uncultured Tateyamaria sp.]
MTAISVEETFHAYEAARHRLPPISTDSRTYKTVETLADVADDFDVFFLDAFGVLNIGDTAISGTSQRIMDLKAAGKRVLVVSNAARSPHATLIKKYTRLDYDFAPEDVITSRATLLAEMNGELGMHWGLMATRSIGLQDLEGLSLTYLEENPALYDTVDGLLLIGSAAWTDARQALLEDALAKRMRPVLVGNPDIVAPREKGFSTEPGHFAHRLADGTKVVPKFFGKPFTNIFDLAFKRIGPVDRARALMVDDSLHTDILGAQTAGIASALISDYGFFAGHDVPHAIARSGIVPDYVVCRP